MPLPQPGHLADVQAKLVDKIRQVRQTVIPSSRARIGRCGDRQSECLDIQLEMAKRCADDDYRSPSAREGDTAPRRRRF